MIEPDFQGEDERRQIARIRQKAWDGYVQGVPWAIRIVARTETSTIVDSRGNLVEVVPSYCDRIGALDVLARGGLGTADAVAEKATLSDLESTLAEEIQRDLGMSLEETRARSQEAHSNARPLAPEGRPPADER